MNAIQKLTNAYKAVKYARRNVRENDHSMLGLTVVDDLGLIVYGRCPLMQMTGQGQTLTTTRTCIRSLGSFSRAAATPFP